MAIGYYLRVGDKTTCGGQILTGDPSFTWYGVHTALEGSAVSCGKNPRVMYQIIGGTPDMWTDGQALAGTLDSISSCPCRSSFIPSIPDCYEKEPAAAAHFQQAPATGPLPFGQQAEPEQHAQSAKKAQREITLTVGVFFDGTGNNADNSADRQDACTGEHFGMSDGDSASAQVQCVQLKYGHSGFAAGSHLGYFTNVHWLYTLYNQELLPIRVPGRVPFILKGSVLKAGRAIALTGWGLVGGTGAWSVKPIKRSPH